MAGFFKKVRRAISRPYRIEMIADIESAIAHHTKVAERTRGEVRFYHRGAAEAYTSLHDDMRD